MKGTYLKFIVLLISVFFLNSCSKDEKLLTTGEANAQNIQSIISKQKLAEVGIIGNYWDSNLKEYKKHIIYSSSIYEIVGPFIKLNEYYYFNLEKMYRYDLYNGVLKIYLDVVFNESE